MVRQLAIAALVLAGATLTSAAQSLDVPIEPSAPDSTRVERALMHRADSAWHAGNRALAGAIYREVLTIAPRNSRAVYQVASLEAPGSTAAIAGFRRYVELEPDDVWGSIALGEALVDAGELLQALEAYDTAVARAPREPDAVLGRARVLRLIGRELAAQTAGGIDRGLPPAPGGATSTPLDGRTSSQPDTPPAAITPTAGGSWDSDGNTTALFSASLDVPFSSNVVLGLLAERVSADGPEGSQALDRARILVRWRPSPDVRLDGNVGIAVNESSLSSGRGPQPRPVGRLRLRWERGIDELGAELRLQRSTVDASATLMDNRVMLEEGRLAMHLPLFGSVRLLASGAIGAMVEQKKRNLRWRISGGPALPVAPALAVGLSATSGGYERSSRAGYFAPSLMQTAELTATLELEELGPVAISADVGAGATRAAIESEPAGDWGAALRGWASLSWSFAHASAISLELEAYSSTISPEVATAAETWSYASAQLSVRIGM